MNERKLPQLPRFASEAEEAQWWFDHRDDLGQDLTSEMDRRGLSESSAVRHAREAEERLSKKSAA